MFRRLIVEIFKVTVDQLREVSNSETNQRTLNIEDAHAFLDMVKNAFADSPERYNHFMDILKQSQQEKIDTPGVMTRVAALFQGPQSRLLLEGFQTFLPGDYRFSFPTDPLDNTVTFTTPDGTIVDPMRDDQLEASWERLVASLGH
ncbi:hypothetical protein BKA70DRAFT_186952 [Coprinopsis sp. MPI-PUGE-AT-0042]|nr:hypothetical protein BKA70DRAFT_186952 [Coprinopsis sp. MPI-PUGE-AT-0042]